MKTVILYYSFSGSTRKEAERLAAELSAPLVRVREAKRRSLLASVIPGCSQAAHRETVTIRPVEEDLSQYDKIILGCPVWSGYPAPAFNAMVALLPPGKEVEVFLCSGHSGTPKSNQGTKKLIEDRGCTVTSYRDIITRAPPRKIED